ncbi:hypothetical protein ACJX0J_030640, partial [Zea mays]
VYFGMLVGLLAAEQLPEEYQDQCQVYFGMLVVVFYAITSFFSLQIGTWEEKNLNTWTN